MSRHWWNQDVIINVDYDEVIEQIPTHVLEEELNERKELQRSDIKEAERQESRRCGGIDINIDPSDYDLINEEDITPQFLDNDEMIEYLEDCGYAVFNKQFVDVSNISNTSDYLDRLQKWQRKDFMCDLLGLSHLATKDEIINEINNRL